MREWHVRLTVRTNEGDGRSGREEYYTDDEMGRMLTEWINGALEDRDDGPYVYWGEVIRSGAPEAGE